MKVVLLSLVLLLLAGCSSALFVGREALPGVYVTDTVHHITWNRLEIFADGSFEFIKIFQPDTDLDFSSRQGWANAVKGSWKLDNGLLVLLPTEEKNDNPAAKIGLEPMQFRVLRDFRHVRLVSGEGTSVWSLRK